MGNFGKQISRCAICGAKIDAGGDTSSMPIHFTCVAWFYAETKTINGGRVSARVYTQETFQDQLFHHELVSAIGYKVQEEGVEPVAEQLNISAKQLHAILTLKRAIPETALVALGYRKMPLYVKIGTLPWPMDLAEKSGNTRRMI